MHECAFTTEFQRPRFSVVDINPEVAVKGGALDQKAIGLMEQRWKLLSALRDAGRKDIARYGKQMEGYGDFHESAHRLSLA